MKKIVIAGASGFIGGHLVKYLKRKNYNVVSLSRNHKETPWNPDELDGWEKQLKSADIIINLAGENVGKKKWNLNRKNQLLNSRISSIDSLLSGLKAIDECPELFIQISGIGYYGNTGDKLLSEESEKGEGFMAALSDKIEKKVLNNQDCIQRKAVLRFGIVLGHDGGALPKLLLPFRFFIGGSLGRGDNYVSWIHIEDVCRMIEFLIENKNLSGIINGVSSAPITNKVMSKIVGRVLKRPSFLPVPPFILKFLLGQMASELLLFSQRVKPEKLDKAGFRFKFPDFNIALSNLVNKK